MQAISNMEQMHLTACTHYLPIGRPSTNCILFPICANFHFTK